MAPVEARHAIACPFSFGKRRSEPGESRVARYWRAMLAFARILVAIVACDAGAPALAARKAFIVGNGNYQHTSSLPNPTNDAKDLAARLRILGYDVVLELDAERSRFLSSFQVFAQRLTAEDIALFYYAGHGIQIGGENYLFPVDARIEKEEDARTRLVPLNALLAELSRTIKSRIVILDACRNNPFADDIAKAQATRSAGVSQGLARVYAGIGSFIAYSTQPGNVAFDGDGRNSPFTASLLQHVAEKGSDVHAVMRRVRADVQRVTGEQQIPWENSSLIDETSFAGETITVATGTAPPASVAPTTTRQPKREQVQGFGYSYVTGLDPKGDNFLALRTSPAAEGVRIATMGPDTLLRVVESQGVWRRVVLLDGLSGWAHSKWIACCKTVSTAVGAPPPAAAPAPATESCDDVWRRRNAIWHRYKYCFTTEKGRQVFGNAGCTRDQAAARAAMTSVDRAEVDTLAERERVMGCR